MDRFGRTMQSLRISVTDRCNLRCRYCMPEQHYTWLPREEILTFEEIHALAHTFIGLGVTELHLTGGEPLLRPDLEELVGHLAAEPKVTDLALTTNGVLLADKAERLAAAGLRRINISLDTLRPERLRALSGADVLPRVLAGIDAARAAGFAPLKLNAVVLRGFNDDEVLDLLEYGRQIGAEVRFIEYMDVGGATHWSADQVVSRRELLGRIAAHYGPVQPLAEDGAPAARYAFCDGRTFGVISSTTDPFCDTCGRSRLTADGHWYLCLYATHGIDLRGPLRAGVGPQELTRRVAAIWQARDDRGAEQRRVAPQRGPFVPLDQLRADRHLEMHTRGG